MIRFNVREFVLSVITLVFFCGAFVCWSAGYYDFFAVFALLFVAAARTR